MRRLFWIALGATAGVLVVRKLQKTAHAYTPAGMAERAGGLGASIRYFADEVRAGMDEREIELREALGIDGGDDGIDDRVETGAASAGDAAGVVAHPTRRRGSTG